MSEILAQMTPEAAERLTVELARRADGQAAEAPDQLPKIEGKPSGTETRIARSAPNRRRLTRVKRQSLGCRDRQCRRLERLHDGFAPQPEDDPRAQALAAAAAVCARALAIVVAAGNC